MAIDYANAADLCDIWHAMNILDEHLHKALAEIKKIDVAYASPYAHDALFMTAVAHMIAERSHEHYTAGGLRGYGRSLLGLLTAEAAEGVEAIRQSRLSLLETPALP